MTTSADDEDEQNPVDQLVDLFVYAPVGLLYEYEEVLPKLIKRGKSQVQLARVLGQMAAKGRSGGGQVDLAEVASTILGRAVTEFGSLMGLAPDQKAEFDEESAGDASDPEDLDDDDRSAESVASGAGEVAPRDGETETMPIAGYDELTAREIIALLDGLSPSQLQVVRGHELANRSRKTVLAKLDRLER